MLTTNDEAGAILPSDLVGRRTVGSDYLSVGGSKDALPFGRQ